MKRLILLYFFSILIIGCNSELKNKEPKSKKIALELEQEIVFDSLEKSRHFNNKNFEKIIKCECRLNKYKRNFYSDLIFQNPKYNQVKNDSLFNEWSVESRINEVKSIRFSGYDSIPKKFSVFKNVEKVIISSRNGISGLDVFTNLKTVHFWNSQISLNTKEKWMQKIEFLLGEKTKFTGISSFAEMPNLRVIYMGFSGFDNFPTDLDKLSCLNELTLGAYMFGEIDLNELDLYIRKG